MNKSHKQIKDIIEKAELCIANMTSSVVSKYRYDADCGKGCINSLHILVLKKKALEAMYDCLTDEGIDNLYESINYTCKDLCGGESVNVGNNSNGNNDNNYLVLGTENGNYITQENNNYILI
jgi:hypothetical protein